MGNKLCREKCNLTLAVKAGKTWKSVTTRYGWVGIGGARELIIATGNQALVYFNRVCVCVCGAQGGRGGVGLMGGDIPSLTVFTNLLQIQNILC